MKWGEFLRWLSDSFWRMTLLRGSTTELNSHLCAVVMFDSETLHNTEW